MAAMLPPYGTLSVNPQCYRYCFTSPYHPIPLIHRPSKSLRGFYSTSIGFTGLRNSIPHSQEVPKSGDSQGHSEESLKLPQSLVRVAVSSVLFLGVGFCFGVRACSGRSTQTPPTITAGSATLQEEQKIQDDHHEKTHNLEESFVDKELEIAFKTWKSKTYALTVPLRIVALRGSLPPSWIKDFIKSQGRRSKIHVKLQGNLESIFSDLSKPFTKGNISPSSALAADIVSIGDSWLKFAIEKAIIEPIRDVENQDWFKGLDEKWKVYLRRNNEGEIDPEGNIWTAPYRWGCMVIAYKKNKFLKHNLAPIEDWADLWRPELAGKISMVDSPREVVGAVLKYMGASYNTNNINLQVAGGREAVKYNLALLGKQVKLFDSLHYLKAFGVGDVWVAVGWSSDVIPVAKRMSNVAVIVPKSGASFWADLWAIPAASRMQTNRIGGRVRGPSPLIHQWIEFCLHAARELPFKQEVIPGSSPSVLQSASPEVPTELAKGNKPRLETNLIAGTPPPDILKRCEFLEPLSDSTLSDYRWLIASLQETHHGIIHKMHQYILSMNKFNGQRWSQK